MGLLDDFSAGAEEIGGYVDTGSEYLGKVKGAGEALGLITPGAKTEATEPWMINPADYQGETQTFAQNILDLQKNIVARGGTIDEIFMISTLPDSAGLAPTGTSLSSLSKIGQARMMQNMYVLASAQFRNSPAQFRQAVNSLLSQRQALGFPQMGRAPYAGPDNPCSAENKTPDGYRSILTDEVCPPAFMPTRLPSDNRVSARPTQDAIARLLAVARGQIPESGVAGDPGADPLAMAQTAMSPSAAAGEECFDRTTFPSPDERLNCIDDYEARIPGTKQRLLRTHKPWEAAMVEGKFAQMATGLNDQRYVVYGKQPPGVGVSLRLAGAAAAATLLGAWLWLRKTKKGKAFGKRRLGLK